MRKSSGSEEFHWFWDDEIWLPPNVTWADIKSTPELRYPEFYELVFPIPLALVIVVIRYMVEKYVFRPLGVYLGLRPNSTHRMPPRSDILEERFSTVDKLGNLTYSEIESLAKKLDWSPRKVERWFRMRKLQNRKCTVDKFAETGWRWFYYTGIFLYGLWALWDKPWFWNIRYCWYQYPHHPMATDIWWYYMIELSFYWSLMLSQFVDVKRKDFWEMFIHHFTTILLMALSWTTSLTRVGTLVLVIHDCADILLEAAKLCKYTNYQRMCDALFAAFSITWIVTRLGVYPTWILYSTTIEAPQIVEMFPAYYIFNVLLSTLLILHVVWTYFILKIVYKAIYSGKTEKDTRSDSSDETLSSSANELEDSKELNSNKNGKKLIQNSNGNLEKNSVQNNNFEKLREKSS